MLLVCSFTIGITITTSAKSAYNKTYKSETKSVMRSVVTDPDMPVQD